MNKRTIKFTALFMAAITLGTGVVQAGGSLSEAHAAVEANPTTKITQATNSSETARATMDTQNQELAQKVANVATVEKSGDETTVTLSDAQLDRIFGDDSDSNSYSPFITLAKKLGTTKIKFYGSAKKGNINIYLSSHMLNKIKSIGSSAAVSLVVGLIASGAGVPIGMLSIGTMGITWYALNKVITKLIAAILSGVSGNFKYGRIYKLRSWKYSGWQYQ